MTRILQAQTNRNPTFLLFTGLRPVVNFIMAHPMFQLFLAWNFSALCSTMPPISENAPYFIHWGHDYLQLLAANLNKRSTSITEQKTPDSSFKKLETSGPDPQPPATLP